MTDRRIRRTRSNIFNSLVSLLLTRDISNITVKELCDKADVNKSTFYLHFMDIYDCKEQWLNELFDKLFSQIRSFSFSDYINDLGKCAMTFLDFFDENLDFYKKLSKSPLAAELMYLFKQRLMSIIVKENSFDTIRNRQELTVVAFAIGGMMEACYINIEHFDRDELFNTMVSISQDFCKYVELATLQEQNTIK